MQVDLFGDPLKRIWKDRPSIPDSPAFVYDIEYAGKSCEEKVAAIRAELTKKGAYALFLSALDEIAWTLNLRGNDVHCNPVVVSYLLITQDDVIYFISPEKVTKEVNEYLKEQHVKLKNYDEAFIKTTTVPAEPVKPEIHSRDIQCGATYSLKCGSVLGMINALM